MTSAVDKIKTDLSNLIELGLKLQQSMVYSCMSIEKRVEHKKDIDALPVFKIVYEQWYSESKACVKQLLPDRLDDFSRHYEPAKNRKELDSETYRIRDFLHGLEVSRMGDVVVSKRSAVTHFQQQLSIVRAAMARFDSSIFDIRQMLQADLMDSEIQAAEQLAKYKYTRAAGAIAGVVLERHLSQVAKDRSLKVAKKNPTINDFNELLKSNNAIDTPMWRFIQHLADIRNLCDHSKSPEPTDEQVGDLLAGVKKVMKSVY